jgi:hypothetical protein
MKILIIGHARHGKDTVAEILAALLGIKMPVSSSGVANEHFIFDRLAPIYGYLTLDECFQDRVNHRAEWFQLIQEFNRDDGAKLTRLILEYSDIYVGLRCRREFLAAAAMFDHIIWVDRLQILPPEPADSNEMTSKDATIIIDNNGTLDELHDSLQELVAKLVLVPDEL